MITREPRIILFDLESLPNLNEILKIFPQISNYPGLSLKAQINSIICFGYKIFGEQTTHCLSAWDYEGWLTDVNDDKELVTAAYNILKDADCVITHNGRRFDWKFIQTRIIKHGLPPLPKIMHIDTCQEAKRNLFLFNNRLNNLSHFLGGLSKLENGGWDLWVKVHGRDEASMKLMVDYCKQDVDVLEGVFRKLRPFSTMPNQNLFGVLPVAQCPNCGSTRLEKHGFRTTKTKVFQRYLCNDCGTTSSAPFESKLPRKD